MTESRPDQTALGIIGGLSWASSLIYYKLINQSYASALGGQHSAPLLMASVDFQPVINAQMRGDWQAAGDILVTAARQLERGGAGAVLIASNTMHLAASAVSSAVKIPFLNIFDAASDAIRKAGKKRVGLLGTRYTMANPFFADEYSRRGIEVIVPGDEDAHRINDIIFRELIKNQIHPQSRKFYQDVVQRLAANGAEGVILGCTEIGLLLDVKKSDVTLFDTAALHAAMGADWLLNRP